MRKDRSIFTRFLIVMTLPSSMVASCNIRASVPATMEIDTPAAQSEQVIEIQPLPTSTFLTQPTDMPMASTSLPQASVGDITPIHFVENGTYADVEVSIPAGANRSYSINAMKGQIMSISLLPKIEEGQWGYGHFKLSGADGTVLCPADLNSECMFWRGVLSSSGNIF